MGVTKVDIKVCRIDQPTNCETVKNVVVDTGAFATALPSDVVRKLGIKPHSRKRFTLADGSSTVKDVGSALIEIDGRKTSDDVISTEKGPALLSVRALEGMGMEVNPKTGKLKKLDGSLLL